MEATSSFSIAHTQYPHYNHPGPAFSATDFLDDSSFDPMFSFADNTSNDMPHNVAAKASFSNTVRSFKHRTANPSCRFRTRVVDNCYKSRLYALALEYYLLEEASPPANDGVRCLMSECPRAFSDARHMLWHLRECDYFSSGKYNCPECNATERFPTTSKRKCSWLRSRLSDKAMQFLHASAAVIKRMIGPRSDLCTNCRHTLKEDFEKTLRGYGSSTMGVEDPPPFVSCEQFNLYPEHGKRPSTSAQSSSSSGSSSQEPQELYGTSHVHELPWEQSRELRSELMGDDTFHHHWDYTLAKAQGGARRCQAPTVTHNTSPTGISHISSRSMVGFSPDVSPTSSGKSPNTLKGAILTPNADFNSFLHINPQNPAADVAQPPVNVAGRVHRQSADVACIPSLPGGMFPHLSLGGNTPNIVRDNSQARQSPPSLNVNIPPESGVHFESMTWGPDTAEFAMMNRILGNNAATPATPTEQTFITALARSFSTPYSGAAVVTPRNNGFHKQEESSSFTSDTSPGSTEEDDSSPGSGGRQIPTTDLQCPECGFTPRGKAEKAATYYHKHQMTHLKKRYSCPQCHKTYSRKDNAAAHAKKSHRGVDVGTPSPAPGGIKRQGSRNSNQLSATRKKSRSYSDESAAVQASGQWGQLSN
ncbi:uncharacterized protein PG986_015165 [Apiospora aurea]|uniref:C2H2-type domain-containing protein n=1 Tax=Apiospora aurea TaxID=335848 RepID=A0ABR1PS35_9PEZI